LCWSNYNSVPVAGTIVNIGTTNIVFTVTDGSSNTANCNFDVVVSDNTNPTISCPANQVGSVNGSCNFTLPDYTGLAIVADNCAVSPTITQVPVAGTLVGIGTTNIVFTVTDGSSNTANCNFDVVVSDNTNPTISCPANQIGSVNGSCNFTLPDYTGLAVASDNCAGVTITQAPVAGTIVSTGTTNIVLIATDGSSNTANCNFDVVVSDNTNPTISCPANQVGSVNGSCNFTLPDYTGLAVVADNCAVSPTITQVPVAGTIVGIGTTNIVFTVTDGSSNTANCNFDVVVSDNTNPTISCPGNQVGSVNGSCNFILPDYTGLAVASDNCAGVTITQVPVAGTIVSIGTTNIVFTVADGSSNTSNCNFDVVVSDNTNPTISCPANQIGSVNGSCNFILPDYTGLAIVADNCAVSPTITQVPVAGTIVGIGTTNIVFTVTDGSSNTANCNFDVVVSDNTNPTISFPANQIGSVNGSCNFTLPDYTGLAIASDNCAGVTITQVPVAGTIVSTGTTNIVLIATDGSSNTANCNFDVIVSDNTNPTISCPGNQVGTLNGSCNFSLPDYTGLVTATDNCNPSPSVTQSPVAGTIISGTTLVTMTVNDGNGNTSSCTFDIMLNDITEPTAVCQDSTAYIDGAGNTTIIASDLDGGSTDNCSGLTLNASQTAFTCADLGANNVTLTATDGSLNTANCVAVVTVIDTISPVVSCPGNQTETPDADCNFTLPDYTGLVSTTDNCGSVLVTQSPVAGTVISGTTLVTMTVADGSGNTSSCAFDVLLNDVIAPTAVCQNSITYLDGAGNSTIFAADLDGGSTDNCSGFTLSASQTAFTCADLGVNNVTLTATDGSLNTANCVAVVTVMDTISPVVSCPGNQTETPDGGCNFTLPDYTGLVTTSDNCSAFPTVTQSPVAGTVISGTTLVTMTSDDGNGNTSSCTFDIMLNDVTAPTVVCQNVNAYIDGTGNTSIVAADLDGGSTDNCSVLTLSSSQSAFTCADLGTNNVTLTATDGNLNTANCVAVVTIIDTISPISTCPGNQTEAPDAACNFTLPDYTGLVTTTDNCGSVLITQNPVVGTVISGTTLITMTVADGSGISSSCTFDVLLNDVTAPTTVCQNSTAYLDAVGNVTIIATDLDGGSTDNCAGLTFSASQTTFTCVDLGANTVTLTATDGNSNTNTCVAVVTVMDTISPTVTCLDNQTEEAVANCQVTLPDYTVAATVFATDNCTTLPVITQSPVAGTVADLGVTTVTLTATDGSGNSTNCMFDLTVSSSAVGTLDSTICNGESFMYNGTLYNEANTSGVETYTGAAANGCDSVVTVTVTVLPAIDVTVTNASPVLTANQVGATYQWIDCDDNNSNIDGGINQEFTASTNGNYAVIVDLSGCSNTSDFAAVVNVGIDRNSIFNHVSIYPNPSSGLVNVELGTLKNVTVNVLTITGQLIYTKTNINTAKHVLELNEVAGIYFVEVISNNEKQSYKLIVE